MSIWDDIDDQWREYINNNFGRIDSNTSCIDIKIVGKEPEIFVNKWNREQYRIEVCEIKTTISQRTVKGVKYNIINLDSVYGHNKYLAGGKKMFLALKHAVKSGYKYIRLYREGSGFTTTYRYEPVEESKQVKLSSQKS